MWQKTPIKDYFDTPDYHSGLCQHLLFIQGKIDKILQGLKNASCYLDDLLFTGSNEEEYLQNLKADFTRLQQAGIKLHPEKCEFMKKISGVFRPQN